MLFLSLYNVATYFVFYICKKVYANVETIQREKCFIQEIQEQSINIIFRFTLNNVIADLYREIAFKN